MHLYSAPSSTLVKLSKPSISEEDRVVFLPAFVHVTFGFGLPVALQNRMTLLPSMIAVLEGAITITGASSKENTKLVSLIHKFNFKNQGDD